MRVVDRIIGARRHHRLTLADVAAMARSIGKVRAFIEAADWTPGGLTDDEGLPSKVVSKQLELF